MCTYVTEPDPHPTNDILIEFETRPKYEVLWFKIYSTYHNKNFYMSRQYVTTV